MACLTMGFLQRIFGLLQIHSIIKHKGPQVLSADLYVLVF